MDSHSSQFISRNWDGYISYVSGERTDFKSVAATWTQPAVTCPESNAWTVFWVGLDGWWDGTVEQGGTSAQCVDGAPRYSSWWEMYPTDAITTVYSISPGDNMYASVVFKSRTSMYELTVIDRTTGKTFTRDEKCAGGVKCDRSSAEVIAEDVGHYAGKGFFPLADYGTMKFTETVIGDIDGNSGSFKDSRWLNAAVDERSARTTYATVSYLNSQGNAFDCIWKRE